VRPGSFSSDSQAPGPLVQTFEFLLKNSIENWPQNQTHSQNKEPASTKNWNWPLHHHPEFSFSFGGAARRGAFYVLV